MIKINNPLLTLKKLITIFFFYMILEGVIRKWVLPNYSNEIYFVKDIFNNLYNSFYILNFQIKLFKLFLVIIIQYHFMVLLDMDLILKV